MPEKSILSFSAEIAALLNIRTLREGGFFRNVLMVMFGTGAAQVFGFLVSPVLSRLYGPDAFGVYGSFIAVAGILGSVLTLEFSEALMLPKEDEEAARLLLAACACSATIATAVALLALLCPAWLISIVRTPELGIWLSLAPVLALLICTNHTLTSWCARRKDFKRTAAAQVVRSVVANTTQAAAGFARLTGSGLIGGTLLGEFSAAACLWCSVLRRDAKLLRSSLNISLILAATRRYKDFPLFSTPQSLLNGVSGGAPVLFLIHYYGPTVGGLYAFSIRILQAPMILVLNSVRQVLFQKLSEVHNSGGILGPIFWRSTRMLLCVAILPVLVGIALAPLAFAFVFGDTWTTAGEYARWLLIWLLTAFCNVPSMLLARILRWQRQLLLFDITLTSTRLATLAIGGHYLPALHTIAVYGLVSAAFNTFLILYAWRRVSAHDRLVLTT